MRLLNTTTRKLSSFIDTEAPDFAILSHRWATPAADEVTLEDISSKPFSDLKHDKPVGSQKVEEACKLAQSNGYNWLWIDSCCIDRKSSAELQESLNSMWNYYSAANVCYAYLADVEDFSLAPQAFENSEWWTRGWTLQELLAPEHVHFHDRKWAYIGTRNEKAEQIAKITGIRADILTQTEDFQYPNVAEKLSWAAHRKVLREEDHAYALLGLFQVYMPLQYGEGRLRAFLRLQEAIYATTSDMSLFLFRRSPFVYKHPLLASSPDWFCPESCCSKCNALPGHKYTELLPPDFSYKDLRRRNAWNFQRHEIIQSSLFDGAQSVTTTFPLVSRIVKNASPRPKAGTSSHIAILNCTLEGAYQEDLDPESTKFANSNEPAICLGFEKHQEDTFHRAPPFVIFVSDLAKYQSAIQRTQLLVIGPGADSAQIQTVVVKFKIIGPFEGPFWRTSNIPAKNVRHLSPHSLEIDALKQMPENTALQTLPKVSFTVKLGSSTDHKVRVSLMQYAASWTIKSVVLRSRGGDIDHSFIVPDGFGTHVDSHSFDVTPDQKASVKLRRLEAHARQKLHGNATTKPSISYEIRLELTGHDESSMQVD